MVDYDTLESKIRMILDECPRTRESDDLLYVEVCKRTNPVVCGMSFAQVMQNGFLWGIPKYDSVRRTRQKIFQKERELVPDGKVTDMRFEKFKETLDYVKQ